VSATSGKTYKDLLDADYNRFTAPFHGGFDGLNIKLPDPFYNEGMKTSPTELNNSAYYTIKRAIDTLSDPEFADINIMTMPGLTTEGLTTHMVNVCEERADALAVIDLPNIYTPTHEKYLSDRADRVGKSPRTVANALRNRRIESSYGCTFYPWVQTRDQRTGQLLWIPPSVAMLGTFASSQRSSQLWFAPAGFNRGGLTEGAAGIPITNVSERLISKDRDTLYEANINPIASFPSSGIVVFGQKTLQTRQSALDRINVRRLVIFMKKQISILSTRVLFEQNVPATWNRFKSLVEPFLANVKTDFGITDYKLILDETTTTPDLIDQNILYAKIMIKPARAIEYIAIDFVIASTGASFED
jgi:phage tail sheath protein FI